MVAAGQRGIDSSSDRHDDGRVRATFTLTAGLLACGLGAVAVAAAFAADGTTETTAVVAQSEWPLTPELSDLLSAELGITVRSPPTAPAAAVDAERAVAISAAAHVHYLGPDDAPAGQYLVEVADTASNRRLDLPIGRPVWIVDYRGLSAPTVGGPITEQGTPAEGSTITRGIVLLDAETGSVLVSHWSGHG